MHGLLGVELPLEEMGDLRQVSQVKSLLQKIKYRKFNFAVFYLFYCCLCSTVYLKTVFNFFSFVHTNLHLVSK